MRNASTVGCSTFGGSRTRGSGGATAAIVTSPGPSVQGRGRASGCASLRRSALRADCPAVLGARGRAQNSPSHGRHLAARAACARCSNRLRSTHRLAAMRNPRAPALLGAAEALRRSPAHGLAGTTERRDERALANDSSRLDALSRAAPSVHAEARVGGGCGASAAPSSAAQRGQSGAQRRTGEKSLWAGPVQGPEPEASQPPRGASSAGEPARSGGRRSEAANGAHPRLCALRTR